MQRVWPVIFSDVTSFHANFHNWSPLNAIERYLVGRSPNMEGMDFIRKDQPNGTAQKMFIFYCKRDNIVLPLNLRRAKLARGRAPSTRGFCGRREHGSSLDAAALPRDVIFDSMRTLKTSLRDGKRRAQAGQPSYHCLLARRFPVRHALPLWGITSWHRFVKSKPNLSVPP